MADLEAAVAAIVGRYLNSGDFNGMPASSLPVSDIERKGAVLDLLKTGRADAVFGDRHPNPHIKAFSAEPIDEQIRKAEARPTLDYVCLYPSAEVLGTAVDPSRYAGRPFTLRLALGDGQLDFRAFDLTVLEHYRNDPRYRYRTDDISGSIGVSDEHYRSEVMREADKVLLQTFGFCYNAEMNRAVAVFLRYLSDLSPEHQQVWAARMLHGDYRLHPSYFDIAMGHRPQGVSIFDAFVHEQHHINIMCDRMGKPHLFREEFLDHDKPRDFGFLIRPTLKDFNDFMLLLDRMMSDNLNVRFFDGDIDREVVEERPDGTNVVTPKGTITMLAEWFNRYRVKEPGPRDEMINAFRRVRQLRMSPAHAVTENEFNQKYFKDQREIIIKAYDAIRTIRLILTNEPSVSGYKVPDWLYEGRIWTQ